MSACGNCRKNSGRKNVTSNATLTKPRGFGFRGRIIAVFILLLAGLLVATLAIVGIAANHSVHDQLSARLQTSEKVWAQLLDANADRLLESVSLLAKDFAFREAVATGDEPTAESALLNHGERIQADLALLLTSDGKLGSSVDAKQSANLEAALVPLLLQAERGEQATNVVVLDGEPYLVALVPVLAPRRIAWVVMGVRYGESFAKQYQSIVGLDVAFIERRGTSANIRASTLPAGERQSLTELTLPAMGEITDIALLERQFVVREFQAADAEKGAIQVLLLADLDEAMAPTRQLMRQIVLLTLFAASIAVLVAILIGRGITRPVTHLAEAAKRIGAGDYAEQLPVRGSDELTDLALAFNSMQSGIAERETQIRHQASHDALTNLPNRNHALDQLDIAIAKARETAGCCAVLMLDLDRFKEVNDTLGHAFGDDVLQAVAKRLHEVVGDGDFLARLGGDEFLVILEGANESIAIDRAQKLVSSLDAPFVMPKAQVSLDASVGVAVFPDHANDAASLLRRSDIAMYEAKQQHSGVAVYKSGHDEHHLRQVSVMGELRMAQERGQFTLAFQPKIDLLSGRIAHVEALLRWQHPQLGRIAPDEFIALAERSGIINSITRFVIDEALRQTAPWIRQDIIHGVAINLSPIDLLDSDLPAYVQERLQIHDIDPKNLVLEVTESTVMRDVTSSLSTMQNLRQSGVRLSIDDFGTGHSSLAHLRRLPVDEIKIDKSFIMALGSDNDDSVIVRSAIEIGHNMGLRVIAEGVEDKRCLEILRALKCDMVQGYYFSAPLAAADFMVWQHTYNQRETAA